MKKKMKKLIAGTLLGAIACTSILVGNDVHKDMFKVKADEVTSSKYIRDTKISVNDEGQLLIDRNHLGNKPMGEEDSWTLFIYMCGSDLESSGGAATSDIKEMIEALMVPNVNIIIQTGGAAQWQDFGISNENIGRYRVDHDSLELIETLPNASMGSSETLSDFISWGVENFAAEHMGVIYWNHGGGSLYGACLDENYDDMLSLGEFEKAMAIGTKGMTDKFDFIGFDACLMATIEVANVFVPYADYFIASEEAESSIGWNYKPLVQTLVDNPDVDAVTLGKIIIDEFYKNNEENGSLKTTTLSLTDLSKIDGVLVKFNNVAKQMYEMANTKRDITVFTRLARMAMNYSENQGYDLVDFNDYMMNLSDMIDGAEEVVEAMKEAVVYQRFGDNFVDSNGLSFYYCYGNTSMRELNVLRNISVSPYMMNFIEKITYGSKKNTLDGFVSNNWDKNKYYYEDNFDYVENEFKDEEEYQNKMFNNEYFAETSFDDEWYEWFTQKEIGDKFIFEEDILADDIEISKDGLISNKVISKNSDEITTANYELVSVIDDNVTLLGEIDEIVLEGTSETKFEGTWFALTDGQLIAADKVNEGNGLTMYRTLVMCDDRETYIYFAVDKRNSILVLGSWEAKDEKTGAASRVETGMMDADTIAPIYTVINSNTNSVEKVVGDKVPMSSRAIVSKDIGEEQIAVKTQDAFGYKQIVLDK